MKLLLTGKPGSGKTTALINFLKQVPDKTGFWTQEVRENGDRVAFELVSSGGPKTILARVDFEGPVVGRFKVDLDSLNRFLGELPRANSSGVLYIDEIGPMELYSQDFRRLVREYFELPNFFVGTIKISHPDELIKEALARKDALLIEVTNDNRQEIGEVLSSVASSLGSLTILSRPKEAKVIDLAASYLKNHQYIQLNKLFNNAVKYALDRVTQSDQGYLVHGNHKDHLVKHQGLAFSCDCDVFNGRGIYRGQAGECSHVQAVRLNDG